MPSAERKVITFGYKYSWPRYKMYEVNFNSRTSYVSNYFYTVGFDRNDCHTMLRATC